MYEKFQVLELCILFWIYIHDDCYVYSKHVYMHMQLIFVSVPCSGPWTLRIEIGLVSRLSKAYSVLRYWQLYICICMRVSMGGHLSVQADECLPLR